MGAAEIKESELQPGPALEQTRRSPGKGSSPTGLQQGPLFTECLECCSLGDICNESMDRPPPLHPNPQYAPRPWLSLRVMP